MRVITFAEVPQLYKDDIMKYEEYLPNVENVDYFNQYFDFISLKSKTAPIKKIKNDGMEAHHIVPKCYLPKELRRDKENIIVLSIEDHLDAHVLLHKAFGNKMTFALAKMILSPVKREIVKRRVSEEEYIHIEEKAKKIISDEIKGEKHPFYKKHHTKESLNKMSNSHKGRTVVSKDNDICILVSIEEVRFYEEKGWKRGYPDKYIRRGENNPFYGKSHTEETKAILREKSSGERPLWFHERMKEAVKGEKNPFYGKHHTEKTKELISSKLKGVYVGEKNPFYGRTHTEEVCKKLHDIHQDTVYLSKGKRGIRVKPNEVDIYLKNGWKKGYNCEKGYWMNNGIDSTIARGETIDNLLEKGWVFGRMKK